MRWNDKRCRKEEVLVHELTEADLANIYGGAKGNPTSPEITDVINLAGLQIPLGLSMPNFSNPPSTVSSSGKNTSAGKGMSNRNDSSLFGSGSLLGILPLV